MKIRGSSSAERSSVLLVHARRKVKCSTGSCSLSSFSTLSSLLQNTTDSRAGLKTSSVRHTDVYRYLSVTVLAEADLSKFSMFGRTGAPTKDKKLFHAAVVVCIAACVLNKMSMMTTVRVG